MLVSRIKFIKFADSETRPQNEITHLRSRKGKDLRSRKAGAPILAKYDADCDSRTESQEFNEFAAVDSVNPLCSLSYWVNNHRLELKIDTPDKAKDLLLGQVCGRMLT